MWVRAALLSLLALVHLGWSSPYREDLVDYNLNTNKNAASPTEYSTTKRTSYTSSPDNWRTVPFYTVLMDKFADGDPSNNDYFGTMYEWDWRETQLRSGGDLKGLVSKLDYLAGMGIKGIFISGTPFINMLWQADSQWPVVTPLACAICSPSVFQVTRPSTSPFSTPTGAPSPTGRTPSTRFTPTGCISWRILRSALWLIFWALTGTWTTHLPWRYQRLMICRYLNTSAPFTEAEHNVVWKDPLYIPWNFSEYKDFSVRPLVLAPHSNRILMARLGR